MCAYMNYKRKIMDLLVACIMYMSMINVIYRYSKSENIGIVPIKFKIKDDLFDVSSIMNHIQILHMMIFLRESYS